MFVVVGVTGGIAAYKAVHLVRLLVLEGHDVHVVPTEAALRFVGLPTWEAISRNPVTTSVYDDVAQVRHVALGRQADLVIVAPATADALAKMAAGLAGDLLGTTLLTTTAPVVVAPAMHTEMWNHPATRHNIGVLRDRGVHVVGPDDGALTGGDAGPGRLSEPEDIVATALAVARRSGAGDATGPGADQADAGADPMPTDLAGLSVVVSAGGTREPIDPVRFLGNRSSGRQGVAVALAAAERGADVTLVLAHVDTEVAASAAHPRIRTRRIGTAAELGEAMAEEAPRADIVVMAAAVADYRVAEVSDGKLSKDRAADRGLTLELVETDDILAGLVAERAPGQTVAGFAAETAADAGELHERGIRKRRRKGVDLLAVNQVGWTSGFDVADNALVLIDADDRIVATTSGTKREVADVLWDAIVDLRG